MPTGASGGYACRSSTRCRPTGCIGIAYCNSRTDAHPIITAVRDLRELSAVRVTVDAVALVELRREERAYRWDPVACVRLSAPARSSTPSARPSSTSSNEYRP
ncbi:hypothetical protein Franean1_1422 [Parafrankia sp. EAN1pec]|nr:hypothetical protein Franean1_1422 [Frankia sp. EAN1pec]